MLRDVYFMNKLTGELVPSADAIHDFYKSHGWRDRWTNEWEETDISVEGRYLDAPDFTKALRI